MRSADFGMRIGESKTKHLEVAPHFSFRNPKFPFRNRENPMLAHNLFLAWKSLRKNPVLSLLMIGAIGLGIGVCMTTLTVYTLMSSNPIPHKSDVLHAVQLDSWDPNDGWSEEDDRPPPQLNWRDVQALLKSDIPKRQAAMFRSGFAVQLPDNKLPPFLAEARVTTRDFFALFDVPFRYGGTWESAADQDQQQVVVLSKKTNDKVFGGSNSVGSILKLDDREYRVIGVIEEWNPTPKFYDLNNGDFNKPEELYVPFGLTAPLELKSFGNTNGWKPEQINSFQDFLNAEEIWIQFWAELPDSKNREAYQTFIDQYVLEQKKLGRYPRPLNNRLTKVTDWLTVNQVVTEDSKVLLGLSFLFLAVCLLNIVGLLLAKFLGKSAETALRRALGATRLQIMQKNLIEVGLIGVLGGALGLLLALAGLQGVKRLYQNYERLVQLNGELLLVALGIALASSLIAGLYPAWRAARLAPAGLLKTQ